MGWGTALFMSLIYAGGFAYTRERRGLLRALVWPIALGIALARVTEREMLPLSNERLINTPGE